MFEKSLLATFTVLGLYLSYTWGESPIGFIAMLTGLWCVILVSKGKISNYYVGMVNCIAYGYVAYNRQLYGEVMLNWGYFVVAQAVGWWLWTRVANRSVHDPSVVVVEPITPAHKLLTLNPMKRVVAVLSVVVGIIIYGIILKKIQGNLPFLDSTTTVLQIIAMILMALRYKEQWAMWILVDVLQITLWCIVLFKQGTNDISALLMWSAFLINAVYGMYNWNKMSKETSITEVPAPTMVLAE
jgi:nicotinamide mononucleotide transporter